MVKSMKKISRTRHVLGHGKNRSVAVQQSLGTAGKGDNETKGMNIVINLQTLQIGDWMAVESNRYE